MVLHTVVYIQVITSFFGGDVDIFIEIIMTDAVLYFPPQLRERGKRDQIFYNVS